MPKKIGILGGLSPESTVEYYLYLTRTYTERYGNYAYPEIIIYSVSFQNYVDWPASGRWDLIAQGLSEAAQKLEAAGADFIIISANTMHLVIEQVRAAVHIPVLSLLDAVGDAVLAHGLSTVGLLGTISTMEKGFYQEALERRGIQCTDPGTGRAALRERRDLQRAGGGKAAARSARPLRRNHPAPGRAWGAGCDPGLHGDPPAGQPGGYQPAAVRHHAHPRRGGAGVCVRMKTVRRLKCA